MGTPYKNIVPAADPREGEWVVEVGSDRGEGSTQYLADWAEINGMRFVTIDINPQNTVQAGQWTGRGENMIPRIDGVIAAAYLDSFDWFYTPEQSSQFQEFYKNYDYEEVTNDTSQRVHLQQAQAVHAKSRLGTVICFDDTWNEGGWTGKGGTAVVWLADSGWKVVDSGGTQWNGWIVMERAV